MTTVSIMQPAYLPWLGFFDRIAKSDTVVILDHISIDKNTKTQFSNRNRVRTNSGPTWLTIPISTKGPKQETPIHDIRVSDTINWQRKHIATLHSSYAKTIYFKEHSPELFGILETKHPRLVDYVNPITTCLLDTLDIHRDIVFSHSLGLQSRKSALVLEICQKCNATRYISGPFGRDYLDLSQFAAAGIEVVFHDYPHPSYSQRGDGFLSHLSVVDLLFNCGPEARRILLADPSCLSRT